MAANPVSGWQESFAEVRTRLLVVRSFIDSLGTGLYLAGSAIFFTRAAGLSAVQVGLGLSIASVVGLIGVVPAGWLAERIGTWRMLLIFDFWRMAGFACYIFVHSFAFFVTLVSLLSIPEQAVNPLIQHLVEQVVGADRRVKTMARLRTVYNVGFTLGAPLTAIALKFDTKPAYDTIMLGDALTFVFAAMVLYRIREVARLGASKPTFSRGRRRLSLAPLRSRRYVNAALINSVMSLHLSLLTIGIPLWVSLHTSVPRYAVGPLLVINTVLAVLMQVPVSARTESVQASIKVMRFSGLALAGCCLLLIAAAKLPLFLALTALACAVALQTVGEVTQAAAGWELSYALAPTPDRAQCLTTFGLSISAQFVFGPFLITGAVIANGSLGWIGLAAGFLACAAVTGLLIRPGTEPQS